MHLLADFDWSTAVQVVGLILVPTLIAVGGSYIGMMIKMRVNDARNEERHKHITDKIDHMHRDNENLWLAHSEIRGRVDKLFTHLRGRLPHDPE